MVNSETPASFFDAMCVGPIAYAQHMPMLSTRKDSIPSSVKSVLDSLQGEPCYVASSPTYVSEAVRIRARATERLASSADRMVAGRQIAETATARAWLDCAGTSLAAKLPDALTAGSFSGHLRGPLLLTDSSSTMAAAPEAFVSANASDIEKGWILGGPYSVSTAVESRLGQLLP